MTEIICGVDVSSTSLQAGIGRDGARAACSPTPNGVAALAGFCHARQVELVDMESTGGYGQQPFLLLRLPVAALTH